MLSRFYENLHVLAKRNTIAATATQTPAEAEVPRCDAVVVANIVANRNL